MSVKDSYDRVAKAYVETFFHELERKPFDRELLDRFAREVGGRGPVCDMGCGPGQVAAYLASRGVEALGVDLSPEMVAHAERLSPGIPFRQGDMLSLDVADGAWAGIAAFYSIIHVGRQNAVRALRELRRALRGGGLLLLGFHGGHEVIHLDSWWEQPVSVDFTFFEPDEMEEYLRTAGFDVEEKLERPPYEFEHPSRRVYILARKSAA
ncbi:class I SAM-dependent methyltransferase [Sorangium sp. So ce1078]|uniref:class I SAM-dependent methyltransferase n=1 Tax=Sorangium sp. So ce1078 TaxID=3133329 RepID=UPI003F5E7C3F